MAQHFNDFSQYTVGTFPSDWRAYTSGSGEGLGDTRHVTIVDKAAEGVGSSGKAIKFDGASSGDQIYSYIWDAVAASANHEVLMRVRLTSSFFCECQATLRSTLSLRTWYQGGPRHNDDLDINKRITGTFVNLANNTAEDWIDEGNWQWTRFRINGDDLYLKAWRDGDSEPAGWDVVDTDTDIASGKVGFTTYRERVFYIDVYAVGTNGDPTPTGPVSTGTPFVEPLTINSNGSLLLPLANTFGHISTSSITQATTTTPLVSLTAGASNELLAYTSTAQQQITNVISGLSLALVPSNTLSSLQASQTAIGSRGTITPLVAQADSQTSSVTFGMRSDGVPVVSTETFPQMSLIAGLSSPIVSLLTPKQDTSILLEFVAKLGQSQPLDTTTSAANTLDFALVAGVSEQLLVAVVPTEDQSVVQDLQVRLGQLQQSLASTANSEGIFLPLVAGTSIPFDDALAPVGSQASLETLLLAAGVSQSVVPSL